MLLKQSTKLVMQLYRLNSPLKSKKQKPLRLRLTLLVNILKNWLPKNAKLLKKNTMLNRLQLRQLLISLSKSVLHKLSMLLSKDH
jgi:hypothetical protein